MAEETVGAPKKVWREPDPFADFPKPSMNARAMFAGLHRVFRPRTYTEIGVSKGGSLARSRTKSIGVDPAFAITAELNCHVRLFRATSDDFFTRPDAFAHFDGVPVDLAYIDGMHLSEYALRDFMNVEKRMARTGVVALDDMLPRNPLEAARDRRTGPWAGDVYKIHQAPSERREMDEITSAEPSTGRPERMVAEDRPRHEIEDRLLRRVVHHRDLLEHHLALGVELGERGGEDHVGHHVEGRVEVLVEDACIGHRVVPGRRRVQLAPERVEDLGHVERGVRRRALEEQVLEEVAHAGVRVVLVPRAGPDPEPDRDRADRRERLGDDPLA